MSPNPRPVRQVWLSELHCCAWPPWLRFTELSFRGSSFRGLGATIRAACAHLASPPLRLFGPPSNRPLVHGYMRADRIDHARAPGAVRSRRARAQRGQHARRRARTPSAHPQGRGRRPAARDRLRRVRRAAVEQNLSVAGYRGWGAGSRRGTRNTGAAATAVRATSFPVRPDECTGATLAAGGRCQVSLRLDTFLAAAADATLRLTEVSGVVHDVPVHGFVIGGYTRDGDAEPGSRCKSDTVLATVTRELEPHIATGPTGLGRRGESVRPGSQETACIVV